MLNRLVILLPLTATVALAAAASDVLAGRSLDLEERTFFPSNPYLSDPNNCGGYRVRCPTDPNGDAVCKNGICSISCDDTCFFSSFSKSCQPNLPSSCGVNGVQCPIPNENGKATCNNGVCSVQCYGNTVYNKDKNTCECQYTQNVCGFFGGRCEDPPNGQGFCYFGVCQIKCNRGYVQDSHSNTCVKQGGSTNSCPIKNRWGQIIGYEDCNDKFSGYSNGVASCGSNGCVYTCNDGYESSQYLSNYFNWNGGGSSNSGNCIATTENNDCCGRSGKRCVAPNNGYASCKNGACVYTCKDGYDYDQDSGKCVPTHSDPKNCGRCGSQCYAPRHGTATCTNGQCGWTCETGYVPSGNCCIPGSSGRPQYHKARRSQEVYTLCPAGETACPIAGSASFATYSGSKDALVGAINNGLMGYECLDTSDSVESCGGCASVGEGTDCTTIPHAEGVGCSAGKCVILNCESGYKPSVVGDKCLQASPAQTHKKGRSKDKKNKNKSSR